MTSPTKIKGIHFQPWIGKNYGKKPFGKLLLFGESHYGEKEDDSSDLTNEVIENFLGRKEMRTPFFRNIGLILNGNDFYKPWHDVAFGNGIQVCLSGVKSQPQITEIKTIAPAFENLVNHLKPQKVLILSKRLWEQWLEEGNWESKPCEDLKASGKQSQVWKYNYNGGSCLCIGIVHPSRMFGKSYQLWKPLVAEFLKLSPE